MGPVIDIHNIYQYTKTFNLINATIKNIAINIWRHPVLSQSEIVCTVAILEVHWKCKATLFSLCGEHSGELSHSERGHAVSDHVVEHTSDWLCFSDFLGFVFSNLCATPHQCYHGQT